MSKRLVSFLLAFIMLIGSFTPAFANGIIIGDESNDTIINNSDKSNDTIINNKENVGNNNSIYEENNNENLESSITIQNGKETDENPSSLVIDNNNTGTEDKLEVSDDKKPEAQTADNNVPPAKDFNEEITEFKQYVRNVTDGQPDSEFVEKLDFHQTPGKVNKIEHKFTLKTRPLSRDYAPGELVIDLTGIEKTREYLDPENNMTGVMITDKYIISNESEFFTKKNVENKNLPKPLFYYCTELTNKATMKKGETIDISYIYQEYANDFYLKNNSSISVNTYLNGKLMNSSLLLTYNSDRIKGSLYPYDRGSIGDNMYSYRNTHIGEKYGFEGKDYKVIDIGYNSGSSSYITKYRNFESPIHSMDNLLAGSDPRTNSNSNHISTARTLMLKTPLNEVYPKLVLTANKDLTYLKADGTIENYKAGADIVLVENGKVVRRLGNRQDTLEKEKKNIGILFAKRDNKSDTEIKISLKLKDTYFKDEEEIVPEKEIQKATVRINKKLPLEQEPKILSASAVTNNAYYEEWLSYKDLFSGVKAFYSTDTTNWRDFMLNYDNPTELKTDNGPKTIKILEIIYNKNNPSENYIYEAKSFTGKDKNQKVESFTEKGEVANASEIYFDGIEELYKKLDLNECLKENYSAKRIYIVEDTGGENGKPFFKNIKEFDNYDKLPQEIKNSLNETVNHLREKEGVMVYQLEDTMSQVPLLHFYGGRYHFSIKNGYKIGEQFVFSSSSSVFHFSIFQNILAAKDDDLEMNFEMPLPAGITYIGAPKLKIDDNDWTDKVSTPPEVRTIEGRSVISLTLTDKEIKEINKGQSSNTPVANIRSYNTRNLCVELPGIFIVDKNLVPAFNGNINWREDCAMKTTVKTSINNLKIFVENESYWYEKFEKHIAEPNSVTKTDDGKFLFTYVGTEIYDPPTTLDCYLSPTISYEKSPEFIAGISNSAKGPEDQHFTIAPKLINFEDFYENKITVQTASTPMTDVTIYNDIENANPQFLNWKGTLKNIDLNEFTNQGFVVETYINKAKHSKNIKYDGWEKYNGSEDLSDVKSLAFKILDKNGNPGVLPKESEYSIVLKMQAPSEDKVPKVDGKPTHSYSKVFTDWRSVNDKTMSGAESFTVRMSMVGSVIDDIIATVNHQVKINRTYSNNFTEQEKKENNIVTLINTKTGNKYITNGNTISYVEPGEYSVSYKTEKGIEVNGDKTIEITDEYKDSIDTINVTYNKPDKTDPDDEPGFISKDTRENKFKITITNKKKKNYSH